MKKLLFKSLMIMGAMITTTIGLTSCSGGDDAPTPTLSVSNTSLSMDGTGGSVSLQVTSNTKWIASSGASWCTISPQSGEGNASVDVTASENTTTSTRTCTIRVRTNDGSLSQDVTVVQNGASVSLSTNGTKELAFTSEKGNTKELDIKCNTEWQISGVPDWLDVPKRNGDGNSTVTFTTLSANNTASQRSATLTISAGSESVSVIVTQAAGLSSVSVTPTNIVVLEDAIAWDLSYSGNLKNFKNGIWEQTEMNKLKDSEIIEKLEAMEATSYQENYIWHKDGLSAETTYVLCFLAYDKSDNKGELIKQAITTRKHDNLAPTADIDYLRRSTSNYMYWTVTPSSKCSSFHMLYGVDISETAATRNPIVYAWIINNCVANGKSSIYSNTYVETNILRQDTYSYPISAPLYEKTNALVATWGKYDNGEYSPKITYESGYFNAMSSSSKQNMIRKKNNSKNDSNEIKAVDLRAFKGVIVK